MRQWLRSRWESMVGAYRFKPYERRVLLGLAWFRAVFTAAVCAPFPWWSWPIVAPLAALVAADFIEHRIRRRLLGYSYNPFVSAIGEWEGWMGPTDTRYGVEEWNAMKCGPPPPILREWWGDTDSFCGHT